MPTPTVTAWRGLRRSCATTASASSRAWMPARTRSPSRRRAISGPSASPTVRSTLDPGLGERSSCAREVEDALRGRPAPEREEVHGPAPRRQAPEARARTRPCSRTNGPGVGGQGWSSAGTGGRVTAPTPSPTAAPTRRLPPLRTRSSAPSSPRPRTSTSQTPLIRSAAESARPKLRSSSARIAAIGTSRGESPGASGADDAISFLCTAVTEGATFCSRRRSGETPSSVCTCA